MLVIPSCFRFNVCSIHSFPVVFFCDFCFLINFIRGLSNLLVFSLNWSFFFLLCQSSIWNVSLLCYYFCSYLYWVFPKPFFRLIFLFCKTMYNWWAVQSVISLVVWDWLFMWKVILGMTHEGRDSICLSFYFQCLMNRPLNNVCFLKIWKTTS